MSPILLLGPPEVEHPPKQTQNTSDTFMDLLNQFFGKHGFPITGNPCLHFFFHIVPYTPPKKSFEEFEAKANQMQKKCTQLPYGFTKTLTKNAHVFGEFGYLKDLPEIPFLLIEYYEFLIGRDARKLKREEHERRESELEKKKLCRKDQNVNFCQGSTKSLTLAAKWCPSLDSSYNRERIAKRMFPKDSDPEYKRYYAYWVRDRLRKYVLKLFRKHDAERFESFLGEVKRGEKKIAAGALLPHEILASREDQVAELQWRRMVEDGTLVTFSCNPQIHKIEGETIFERKELVETMEWGGNTDFQKFDQASMKNWEPDYMKPPQIVFWNLRDSRSFPVVSGQEGVALVSGFSKNLKNLLKGFMDNGGEKL
ncbi:hypothetical protein AMTRI_Chr06g192460 [Amborella trichopoda]